MIIHGYFIAITFAGSLGRYLNTRPSQQQIHFNGNIFGNQYCRCNEGSLFPELSGKNEFKLAAVYEYHCIKKIRKKSRECHNHKPQLFPDTKRKWKATKPNKHKSNKRTKSTKISFLFPKRGNRNAKRTEKHKNKITQGKI